MRIIRFGLAHAADDVGVKPKRPTRTLRRDNCKDKVHQQSTLGIGRRILVSRNWSGKTLADHRADAHAWVKALLLLSVDSATAEQVDA